MVDTSPNAPTDHAADHTSTGSAAWRPSWQGCAAVLLILAASVAGSFGVRGIVRSEQRRDLERRSAEVSQVLTARLTEVTSALRVIASIAGVEGSGPALTSAADELLAGSTTGVVIGVARPGVDGGFAVSTVRGDLAVHPDGEQVSVLRRAIEEGGVASRSRGRRGIGAVDVRRGRRGRVGGVPAAGDRSGSRGREARRTGGRRPRRQPVHRRGTGSAAAGDHQRRAGGDRRAAGHAARRERRLGARHPTLDPRSTTVPSATPRWPSCSPGRSPRSWCSRWSRRSRSVAAGRCGSSSSARPTCAAPSRSVRSWCAASRPHATRPSAPTAPRASSSSRMSHELRTPLNGVLGFAQLLEMRRAQPRAARSRSSQILKGGRHLLDLINEVLDITRIEAGTLPLSPEPVLVPELVDECVDARAAARRPAPGAACVAGPSARATTHVLADRQRLKQVLLNLLSNAIKYNRGGGTVVDPLAERRPSDRCAIARRRHRARASAPTELGAAVHAVRAAGRRAHRRRGHGDRAGAVAAAGEAMGGRLDVPSRGRAGQHVHARACRSWRRRSSASRRIGTQVRRAGASAPTGRARSSTSRTTSPTSRLVERLLDARGDVELVAAMQGRLGLELARQHRPVVVLLDLHLPDIDGDEVLRQLRDDPTTATHPGDRHQRRRHGRAGRPLRARARTPTSRSRSTCRSSSPRSSGSSRSAPDSPHRSGDGPAARLAAQRDRGGRPRRWGTTCATRSPTTGSPPSPSTARR